jgi:hypothetical protein
MFWDTCPYRPIAGWVGRAGTSMLNGGKGRGVGVLEEGPGTAQVQDTIDGCDFPLNLRRELSRSMAESTFPIAVIEARSIWLA